MFGLTKLTPEEQKAHEDKKRKEQLEKLILQESNLRRESLARALEFTEELEKI